MADDTAYTALNDDADDHRWAYGTGFDDPLSGVDTPVPPGVDGADLAAYCLMLGDDALLLSQRLQEWITRAPELEEETALANIALDLLGQARLLLSRAGAADGTDRGEDAYAFERAADEFSHVELAAEVDGDFAGLIARLTVFTIWRLAVFERLQASRDPVLAAVAVKAVKELTYHRDYAAQWMIRLGDGTDLSHERMQRAVTAVAAYVPGLFGTSGIEERLAAADVAVRPASVRAEFDATLAQVVAAATLSWPRNRGPAVRGGRHRPSPAATALVQRMQTVARALPGATW